MDKPLARDKDDQDRDAHLKAIERAEDPMLQYMRKKQKKAISGLPRKLFIHHCTTLVSLIAVGCVIGIWGRIFIES